MSADTKDDSYAFVIRIWLEEDATANDAVFWRGHITNVLDHRRRYFQDLTGITHFIRPYLEQWGAFRNPKSEIRNSKS